MDVIIREGAPDDAQAASSLAFSAKASLGYSPDWLELWRDVLTIRPDYLAAQMSLVAVCEGKLVGVCVLEKEGDNGSLEHVWIAPTLQRQGIGRVLVERALDLASQAGIRRVVVESDPAAAAFYTRLGARACGRKPAPMPGAPERELPVFEFFPGRGSP
jgi:predicted N-acetyltransferase YhbS